MHELGITRNLVALVGEAAKGRLVRKVSLEIGKRSVLMPQAMRFCFDVVSKGTLLENAVLEIIEIVPGWQCADCAAQHEVKVCRCCVQCGSTQLRQRTGEELNIKSMEVETCA